ncbi:hypothetical protein Acsp02_92390 [Actinoplanes sp. NBRC 103695]|nr:hypothetical protein Acsp02_92390 [Actinoplanes sp. NBRC 103695]
MRTPAGGLARPEAPATALTAQELIACVQETMSPGHDLRLLVDDGVRNASTLGLVADGLGCDLLVTPVGARVERLAGAAGEPPEAVPVDRVSGAVVDWVVIQPPTLATTLPSWFELAGGLVLHRSGLATLPLPGGLEFANRDDFVVRRAAAAGLGAGHPSMVTVAAATRAGGFRLSAYHPGTTGGHTGQDIAAALSSIPLYGGDLRLWLRWPDGAAEQRLLTRQVAALAEATGATVWTPRPGGEVVLLRGCRDLAARDGSGEITGWIGHRPPATTTTARFATDRDGRLMPSGPPVIFGAGAVTMVSTGRRSEEALREQYAGARAEPGTVLVDLTILEDGRLALRHADGADLAAGPAELHAHLEDAGWQGEDLLLLTPVVADRAAGLHEHLLALESDLGVEIWSLEPGAEVSVVDGLPQSVGERQQPARWVRAGNLGDDSGTGRWRNDDGWLIPRRRRIVARARVPAPVVPTEPPPPERVLPAPSPRPALTVPSRSSRPHGVRWLPGDLEVNAEPVDLWIGSEWPAERVATDGVPGTNLFLIGQLDGEKMARAHPRRHLLCLRVGAGGAVAMSRLADVPTELRHQAIEGGAFLLPAGWLDRTRLQAAYPVDPDGQPGERTELSPNPVTLRFTGARHGMDGLSNDVVPWPRSERGVGAWAVLTESPSRLDDDYLRLHVRRPEVTPGGRLVHLHVAANRAIDVPATASRLVELASVRSRLPELVAGGVTLLLPRRAWERTRVDQVLRPDGDRWRHVAKGIDLPLPSLMAPEQAGAGSQPGP